MSGERYLVVGLGNPGKEYEGTPHNVGFQVADALAAAYQLSFDGNKAKARFADGLVAGQRVMIAKPQTYMNLSGAAVRALVDFYKIDVDKLLVVCDHLDIPLGSLRIRLKGGAGGQRGLRNIHEHLGTQDILQLRMGIGRPPGKMDPAAYVLRPFKGDSLLVMQESIDRAIKAIETWLRNDINTAMNLYNGTADEVTARLVSKKPMAATRLDEKPSTDDLTQ